MNLEFIKVIVSSAIVAFGSYSAIRVDLEGQRVATAALAGRVERIERNLDK